jgi:hypothetical protein
MKGRWLAKHCFDDRFNVLDLVVGGRYDKRAGQGAGVKNKLSEKGLIFGP